MKEKEVLALNLVKNADKSTDTDDVPIEVGTQTQEMIFMMSQPYNHLCSEFSLLKKDNLRLKIKLRNLKDQLQQVFDIVSATSHKMEQPITVVLPWVSYSYLQTNSPC